MKGPRLDVPCPRCGAVTPAGVPRHATVVAISETEQTPNELNVDDPWHVESRCDSGHEVHVYYARHFSTPPE